MRKKKTWHYDVFLVFRFLGTSGQNIDDLEKYSEAKDKLDFMERTLRWRHIAPTAPNTLGNTYPAISSVIFFYSLFCNPLQLFELEISMAK